MNLKISPLRSAIVVGAVIACLSIALGIGCDWSGAVVLLTYGAVASPLCCYAESGNRLAKRILLALASVVFGVIPCVVVIGGIDCEPINDSDLLLPESETHYCADGNGWAVLSNLLGRVERSGVDESIEWHRLWWYADPTNQEWVLECYDDSDFLSNFTNTQRACAYVKAQLQSNEWVTSGVDATVSSPRYAPPPPRMLTDYQAGLPICGLLELNRCFLAAELRCAIESGDFEAAIALLQRNLRLATLLQTQCGTFVEYLVGTAMIDEDISCLEQILADNMISQDGLNAVDMALNDLPGFSDESVSRALKREYAIIKESSRVLREEGANPDWVMIADPVEARFYAQMSRLEQSIANTRKRLDNIHFPWQDNDPHRFSCAAFSHAFNRRCVIVKESLSVFSGKVADFGASRLFKLLCSPIYRYYCHPNRTLRQVSTKIRSLICTNVLENITVQKKDCEDKCWYDRAIPNSCGRSMASADFRQLLWRVREIKENVRAFRNRIREKAYAKGKSCPVGEFFPLVLTNGCY